MNKGIPVFRNYLEFIEFIELHGLPYERIGKNWQKNWVISIPSNSNFLVTSGAHGDEYAAMAASIFLAIEENKINYVPLRDPSGINGFDYNLKFLTDYDGELDSNDKIKEIIRNQADWVFEEEDLIIGVFWNIAVCYTPPIDDWSGEDYINERIQSLIDNFDKAKETLEGLRILMPANLPKAEGVGALDRTFTSYVVNGKVLNLNRLFHIHEIDKLPEEFTAFKKYLDTHKPKIVIDLHEGYGDKFYQFIKLSDGVDEGKQVELAKIAIKSVRDNGYPVLSVAESKKLRKKEARYLNEGAESDAIILIEDDEGQSLTSYSTLKLKAFSSTFETGLQANLSTRVYSHFHAIMGVLEFVSEEMLIG